MKSNLTWEYKYLCTGEEKKEFISYKVGSKSEILACIEYNGLDWHILAIIKISRECYL